MYEPCEDFKFSVSTDWIWANVLQLSGSRVQFKSESNQRVVFEAARHLPPQIALACVSSRISAVSKSATGTRRLRHSSFLPLFVSLIVDCLGPQVWTKRFYCGAHNCPTRMEMSSVLPDREPSVVIQCRFTSTSPCVHIAGDLYGQCRGPQRADWSDKDIRPHSLTLTSLSAIDSDRFLTGNMQHHLRPATAQRIVSDKRTSLRMDKDTLISLREMAEKDSLKDWISLITIRPAAVVLTSHSTPSCLHSTYSSLLAGAARIWRTLCTEEPGIFVDATGSLVQGFTNTFQPSALPSDSCLHFMFWVPTPGGGSPFVALEVITSDQTAGNLVTALHAFERVLSSAGGDAVRPVRANFDCGLALLVAAVRVWNRQSVQEYLDFAWQQLRTRGSVDWTGRTAVSWCRTHIVKAVKLWIQTKLK